MCQKFKRGCGEGDSPQPVIARYDDEGSRHHHDGGECQNHGRQVATIVCQNRAKQHAARIAGCDDGRDEHRRPCQNEKRLKRAPKERDEYQNEGVEGSGGSVPRFGGAFL